MELWEYFEVLWRWGWVILLVTALCAGATIGYARLQTPRYTSIVELSVTPERIDQGLTQTVAGLLRNYASGIQTLGMAQRVVDRLGLVGWDAADLRSHIEAEADQAQYRVKIEVTDTDPLFAQRVAQTVSDLFVSDVREFADLQDPRDRLVATPLNGGAQAATQTWPRNKLLLFLGVGGGLFLGMLAALVLEWSRVVPLQTQQQVEESAGIAVIGTIPHAGRSKSS